MKKRAKSIARSIRLTPEANRYLNHRAQELGLSGAEYSRRMLFLECWDGLVFDDVRAIEAKAKTGMPIADYLPYARMTIERLQQGEAEVEALDAFVREHILPALAQAKARITAVRERKEGEARNLLGIDDMVKSLDKATRRGT